MSILNLSKNIAYQHCEFDSQCSNCNWRLKFLWSTWVHHKCHNKRSRVQHFCQASFYSSFTYNIDFQRRTINSAIRWFCFRIDHFLCEFFFAFHLYFKQCLNFIMSHLEDNFNFVFMFLIVINISPLTIYSSTVLSFI